MRAVVQRVSRAAVVVDGETVGAIEHGLLVYLGVARDDAAVDVAWLAEKVAGLRVFPDEDDKLNRDVRDVGGGVLVVSAFTTQADARKGRRPSFDQAAPPDEANALYEAFCAALASHGVAPQRGRFRATMSVESVNAGPVCILLDSKRVF